jgi:hypothetical protein
MSVYGGPRQVYSEQAAPVPITRIGAYGGPRQVYGVFAGGDDGTADAVTRLGQYGGPRQRYGSFADRSARVPPVLDAAPSEGSAGGSVGGGGAPLGGRSTLPQRAKAARILREDDEIMAVIKQFLLEV